MWMATNFGFFSVVQKPGDDDLTIRARVEQDLDQLRERYLPTLGPIETGVGTDYPHRAKASHDEFAAALGRIAHDITYSNFKGEVAEQQGDERANVYHKVWHTFWALESK